MLGQRGPASSSVTGLGERVRGSVGGRPRGPLTCWALELGGLLAGRSLHKLIRFQLSHFTGRENEAREERALAKASQQ